ncbi:fasciclin domain-containing protein [Dermatobacter hominis]|uniref:fasciclin domain-containing protein n=1 Tax=Dermatobacter hominis TaxID=2884263 RepID=UPI001D0F72EA|nr:fasciclin domain-containing protein [Dermatobacter hominis]UDY36750.1 fasciclin domain-containing protein [Dermatobacter hominis]
MRYKFLAPLVALLLGVSLVAAACSDDSDSDASSDTTTTTEATTTTAGGDMADETIVDIAAGNPDFSTLVELVTSAGLAETLSGAGPFTVFAPTNEAFSKVPAATLQQLQADPTGALADVLKLHVVSGKVLAADAMELDGQCVDTLGGKVKIAKSGDDLTIGGATITQTDLEGSNGVVHVIDSVITAPSTDC